MNYTEKAEALTQNLTASGLLGLVTELCREIDGINSAKLGAKKECLKENLVISAPKKKR